MTEHSQSYPDTEDGQNTPDEALDLLMHEAGWTDMHGDDHHEDDCPICRSIAIVRAGLNHAYQPSAGVAQAPTYPVTEHDQIKEAIELARIGAGKDGYRSYPGTGGIWAGRNEQFADATFVDWGLARATALILNAAVEGQLVLAPAQGTQPEDRLSLMREAFRAGQSASGVAQRPQVSPLSKRLYALSEPHLSGYRLVLGFETLADSQAAHEAIALSSTDHYSPEFVEEILKADAAPPEAWINAKAEIDAGWPDSAAVSSTDPRCTCAAIVNPNIPHARSCPLSSTQCESGK